MDEIDYKFGQKNNWRRTLWNAAKERLQVPVKDAVVLYLAGESDLDRPVALSKGFKPANLIAVDRAKKKVASLRDSGTIAIQSDFIEAVSNWNGHIDLVLGDFCCPLSEKVATAAAQLPLLPHLGNSVFAWNFMRGREADEGSRAVRSGVKQLLTLVEDRCGVTAGDIWKHRGYLMLVYQIEAYRLFFDTVFPAVDWATGFKSALGVTDLMETKLLSYLSTSGQTFDSIVFRSVPHDGHWCDVPPSCDLPLRRRIAAAKAIRTMKLREGILGDRFMNLEADQLLSEVVRVAEAWGFSRGYDRAASIEAMVDAIIRCDVKVYEENGEVYWKMGDRPEWLNFN